MIGTILSRISGRNRPNETPYPKVCVGVSNQHQLVNLYLCALGPDGALKDTRFILVWAKCPYVQSVAARVISTESGS